MYYRKGCNGAELVVNSSNLIAYLLKRGLLKGNKVKNQVDIPGWVLKRIDYRKACVRGLIDTDGSFYKHEYAVRGKKTGILNYVSPIVRVLYPPSRRKPRV